MSLVYFTLKSLATRLPISRVDFYQDGLESPTFLTLPHVLGVFYVKSHATRLPITRVDFYQDESSRLESTRVESQTLVTLPHALGVFYAKSLATRLPISRVDFYQDESSRLESSRRLFLPYPMSLVYFTLSPSPLDFQ